MADAGCPRVLQLRSSTDLTGPDHMLLDLSAGLRDQGFEPHVGALSHRQRPAAPLVTAARCQGLQATVLPSHGPVDSRLIARVARLVRRERIALLHAHEPKGQVVGAAVARLTGRPLVVTHHGWLSRTRRERVYERLGFHAMKRTAEVIAVCEAGARELTRRAGSPPVTVVPNGIRLDRLGPPAADSRLRQLGIDPGLPLLVAAGRLEAGKGFDDLLEAAVLARTGRPLALALLGDGPRRAALARRAAEAGLALVMPGHVDDAPALMARAAVFVLASRGEGSPIALLEAMGQGRPVIATRVGDAAALIRDGEQGLLVDAGAPAALAAAIGRLLDDDRRARALGIAARARVREERDHGRMTARYTGIYRRLLSR
jgi:glycosyltransferase involved in cell wall biosynthesis